MTDDTTTQQPPMRVVLRTKMHRQINDIQTRYLREESRAKAQLSLMRASTTRGFSEMPDMWPLVLSGLPANGSRYNEPSRAESAVYTAFGLYGTHQQSRRFPMNVPMLNPESGTRNPTGFGDAVRRLADPSNTDAFEQSTLRRFRALATAQTFEATRHHARGLIQQFRALDIPLDYGQLTVDLYELQFPDSAPGVRLRWGRQLHRTAPKNPS
ncbi:type I-E CRISPR-associated protein Cse2/CasB [Corynebacterium antarcticum]|uniref:type I-E CRISPR-associated protein Cse2/CasB n=1 Tax=Corynebacterium antarcticum TaxID=2800405 RepID=UPI0020055598|nr:type I-E CRISPR-associated protein Cse2/CasB [Corynebacterium antarcticum]MCK7659844.1 type I-E CRISPR-associated protein Cse2/CasB [Corynebacterium antarcticum]